MVGLNSHDILRCTEFDEARFFDCVAEVSSNQERFIHTKVLDILSQDFHFGLLDA